MSFAVMMPLPPHAHKQSPVLMPFAECCASAFLNIKATAVMFVMAVKEPVSFSMGSTGNK